MHGRVPNSRISIAVQRLASVYRVEPGVRLTPRQIAELVDLEPEDARIVIDTLKDAGFLEEREDGSVSSRRH